MLTTTQSQGQKVCLSNAPVFLSAALLRPPDRNNAQRHDVRNGYGACSKCNCPGFEGSQDTCGNCGHNYTTHW